MIFGTDDRTVKDYTNVDGRFVQIKSTFSDGTVLLSSGVMVGANDVLTSAHNFYSAENGGLATNVVITPSSFNDYEPFGSTTADHFYLTEEWTLSETAQYDYGVISLSSSIGYQTGWVDYGYLNDLTTTADTQMTAYGYAYDVENGDWLISTSGQPDSLNGNTLLFSDDLDTLAGQSGSGVLIASDTGSDVLIGLLSDPSFFPDSNGVFALDASSVANIDEWITLNDDNLTPPKTTDYNFSDVQDISLLYFGLLGRTPDEAGLKYWSEQLSGNSQFYDIIGGFLDSGELNNGTDYTGDNESFVSSLYTNILLRDADAAGMDYWLNELNTVSSKEKVISGFLESVEYREAQSLNTYTIWHNWFESFSREIAGTDSNEILSSGALDDYIDGGAGDDVISGLGGDDYLYSNIGNDTITGGEGSDYFVFDLTQSGVDTITDFDITNDKIHFLTSTQNLQIASTDTTNDLVLYEDEDTYIVLTGLTVEDYSDISFV